jgi:hypothetical protein
LDATTLRPLLSKRDDLAIAFLATASGLMMEKVR